MADVNWVSPKNPSEVVPLSYNHTLLMGAGETILSASFAIVVVDGDDPGPSLSTVGIPVSTGPIVVQQVGGGLLGVTYDVICTAITSKGNTYSTQARILVRGVC